MTISATMVNLPTEALLSRDVAAETTAANWPTSRLQTDDQMLLARVADIEARLDGSGSVVAAINPGLDEHQLSVAAWNLITLLSTPVPQYDSGELIYSVEVRSGEAGSSHYSASNSSGGLHTDGSLLDTPPHIGALLCLSPAAEGGETVLVDVQLLVDALQEVDPNLIALLEQAHPFAAEDDGPEIRQWAPVLSATSNGTALRYLRRYLTAGWKRAEALAPERLTEALDIIDHVSEAPGNQTAYALGRGEILIWRNSRFIHGRRAFTEQAQRRRLVRIYGRYEDGGGASRNGSVTG